MKLTRSKKIILTIILIVGILFMFSNDSVFAAINTDYSGVDVVTDTALETAFDESSLLGLLAKLVYAIGRFLEWILGSIFKMLTGVADFPWADKIVFNSVALLDVNFINPDTSSFVGNPNIKVVLQNIYSTVLSLAVSFFGIVVLITAVKLVISTIASEKAKYKQAIVDWAVGLVLLFCMHYFISFVFYLNEELVKVASSIVKDQINRANAINAPIVQTQTAAVSEELVERIKSKLSGTGADTDVLTENMGVVQAWLNLNSEESSKGAYEYWMKNSFGIIDITKFEKNEYLQLIEIVNWVESDSVTIEELRNIRSRIKVYRYEDPGDGHYEYAQAMLKSDYSKLPPSKNAIEDRYIPYEVELKQCEDSNELLYCSGSGKKYYLTQGAERFGYSKNHSSANSSFYWTDIVDDLIRLKAARSDGGSATGGATGTRLIADLATYFRYNSYTAELRPISNTGVKNTDNIKIQNMLMYTILVAQSLILFIAYIKRLFYVLMLALLAPVVVVVDFFQKFGK